MWEEMSYNWYVYGGDITEPEVWDVEYEPNECDFALWIYENLGVSV